MQLFHFIAGTLVLLFGRPLYWVLVAVLGFLIGYDLVRDLAVSDSEVIQFLIALAAGIIAAGLAVAFQWLAFGLVGFLAGSYLVQAGFERYGYASDYDSILIIVGGVIGAVVALNIVDWAVIVLSALAGATMISDQIEMDNQLRLLVLLGLTVVGVAFQRKQLNDKERKKHKRA